MYVYAGIDEAGYSPMFGPLVVARSVFTLDQPPAGSRPPSLWGRLAGVLCKSPRDRKGRVAVNDSKRLYTPALGLEDLERGVLTLLTAGGEEPLALEELLELVAADGHRNVSSHPWYTEEGGGPALPVAVSPQRLSRDRARLARAAERQGVRLADAAAAVVFEDQFNRLVRSCGSKAGCSWSFVAGHLRAVWRDFGSRHPMVVVDRQGGRRFYGEPLEAVFPGARLEILEETPRLSRYRLMEEGRSMEVEVRVAAEVRHLPVAYASMLAKYLRELLLLRFHGFWRRHAPEVRPTYGYFGDGRRFLAEIEPLLVELEIDPEDLVRCC